MSRDEWLEKVLADRPPLSSAQVAALRHILAPHGKGAAPAAEAETAPETTRTATQPERTPQ